MMTFQQHVRESSGMKIAAAVALTAKISGLNRQLQQDRTATNAEKTLSTELVWLAALIGLAAMEGKGR
jgi:hypothetical protein